MLLTPSSIYQSSDRSNLLKSKKKLFEFWENFMSCEISEGTSDLSIQNPSIRSIIVDSWKRSQKFGINPYTHGSIKNYSYDTLKNLRENDRVLKIAYPIIKQLNNELRGTGHIIFLCNREGIILNASGDRRLVKKIGNSVNAVPGSNWTEKWAGTNAIGTSLELKKPVQLFAFEHFTKGCHEWSCTSAPVLDPFTGEVIAVLNLSTESDKINERSMVLAIWGASSIEKLISKEYFQAKEMMNNIFVQAVDRWKNNPVFLLDFNNNLLLANELGLTLMPQTDYFKNNPLSQNTGEKYKNEWETDLVIKEQVYRAWIKEVYWRQTKIGNLVVLSPKCQTIKNKQIQAKYSFSNMIGSSPAFQQVLTLAKKAASSDANILITSESGTGKELLANAIHKASSRADKPFIAINCGAFSKELISSELFGYVGGAFTGAHPKGKKGKFELANGGTLFLDEIGEMSLEMQVQLLRAIQEQEIVPVGGNEKIPIDVRIIAATHRDLRQEIQNGNFRQDLFYRIKVFELELPALRDRKEDIPSLCDYFIDKFSAKRGIGPFILSEDALELLQNYSWPGNIRELENAIEYAVNVTDNDMISSHDLPKEIFLSGVNRKSKLTPAEKAELHWILETIQKNNMNISQAAEELKMNRSTVYRKLQKYGYDINAQRSKDFK